jgi:hypothetical protein
MMDHVCLRDDDLAEAAALPAEDPVRRQWMACARCRARVAAFAEFLQPTVVGKGAEWDEADARLAAALESEIQGRSVEERTPVGERTALDPGPASRGSGGSRSGSTDNPVRRFFRQLMSPSLRPVAALGVLVVALVTIQGIRTFDHPKGDAIVLRQGAGGPAAVLEAGTVKPLPDGAISLSWTRLEGADRYEVVLYGEDLTETERLDAAATTTLTVPAAEKAPLFWRVIAYRGGDVISQSKIRSLRTQPH